MITPTFADVQAATVVVHQFLQPTPLIEWPALSKQLGFRYLIKHENHHPTTAFKIRGGVYLVSRLPAEEKLRGIIGCTTGNHGQSLAYAGRVFGVRCVLVVPVQANPDKVEAMRSLGAELVLHGADFDEAKEHCERIQEEQQLRYIHSANEPDLIAGVGSYGMEIFDREPNPDVILVPVGLGSGICGMALAAAGRNPKTQIIGVQAEGASAVTQSWQSGKMVCMNRVETFAEGVATRVPAEMTMDIMRRHVSDMILVKDEELRQGIRRLLQYTHNLAEGAGAASTAAAWKMRDSLRGKTVVGVLSGGNLDLRELRNILLSDPSLQG